MDFEKKERRQNLRVIVSEAVMVLAVAIMVTLLGFIVSGYWVNSDFEVKRQGMLQISSAPTGADIVIDDSSSWLQRTNASKVLDSGEHTVVLKKDGYDTWSKKITISDGLLYRLHYPRLFLNDRFAEKLISTTGTTTATISPDREILLLINNTTKWKYVYLNAEKLEPKEIDISGLFTKSNESNDESNSEPVSLLDGEVTGIDWSADGRHVIFKVVLDKGDEWIVLDIDNAKNSINLTREFGADFSDIKIFDRSANSLFAVQNGNLHKVDVSNRSMSVVLVENIIDFGYYNNEIFFSANSSPDDISESSLYYVGKIGSNGGISRLGNFSEPLKIVATRFYDEKLVATLSGNIVTLYDMDSFSKLDTYELSFSPQTIEAGHNGEFIIAYSQNMIATLDMEVRIVHEWATEGENFGWLDNDMIYTVHNGELIVYDYDGLNRRAISKNVSSHFPVGITNNKYLYYFSDDFLTREWLTPR